MKKKIKKELNKTMLKFAQTKTQKKKKEKENDNNSSFR